ncbi:MAG: TMEM175 family protein [Methanoregula sp.]|nr:TMEM175 family protein [Methanoregula sp.]
MTEIDSGSGAISLTKGRLEGLSDGIFAFAMTLLVIGLNIPDKATLVHSNAYALQFLLSLRYDFPHYVLAFLILGAFWLGHHIQLHAVKSIDRTFVWINLLTLMFVALLPFSTSFSGDFSEVPFGAIVFEANLFAIGIGMFCQWQYITKDHRLTEPSLEPAYVRKVSTRNLVVPGVSLLCILVALAGSTWSSAIYMTLPVVDYVVEHIGS